MAHEARDPSPERTQPSALDTTFGIHSRRGEFLRENKQASYLQFDSSAFTHLHLSTISALARVAEKHPNALKYFPEGSKLSVSATGESGSYCEDGHLTVYCELKFATGSGTTRGSGREAFTSSMQSSQIVQAFTKFLERLEGKELSEGGDAL